MPRGEPRREKRLRGPARDARRAQSGRVRARHLRRRRGRRRRRERDAERPRRLEIVLDWAERKSALLFGETTGRALISFAPDNEAAVRALAREKGVPFSAAGWVGGDRLPHRRAGSSSFIDEPVAELGQLWRTAFAHALESADVLQPDLRDRISPGENSMTLSAGTRLGPYEMLAPLGAGGMGEVYRRAGLPAHAKSRSRCCRRSCHRTPSRLRRFEKEARSASALNHPNIVTIYDIGSGRRGLLHRDGARRGKTLRELLVGGALPIKRLLQIARADRRRPGQGARGRASCIGT